MAAINFLLVGLFGDLPNFKILGSFYDRCKSKDESSIIVLSTEPKNYTDMVDVTATISLALSFYCPNTVSDTAVVGVQLAFVLVRVLEMTLPNGTCAC